MAQIVKLRRSGVSGQKPTNTNLQLGEIALNTTDGKLFFAKSGSLGPTIEEVVTTNTINTGSINISGSINLNGNQTISGSLNITGSLTASGLNYPTVDGGEKSFIQTDGNGNLTFQYVETLLEPIYNGESFQLVKGTPVYISGSQGADPIVYVADAANPNKMPVIYIVNETIASGETGTGILLGKIDGVDTTGYSSGTEIYVAPGGGWTSTRPTGTSIIQSLGVVTKEGSGGKGIVLNPGPANLPNIAPGNVWVGDLNSHPLALPTSSIQNVLSSSFATTASFALSAGGVNAPIGTYNTLVVTTPSTTWNFQHNTGQQYPIFQVFNENGYVIIPSQIRTIDNDNAEIIFSSPQSGRVVASLGGGNGTTKEFTNSNLWVVDHDLGTDYPDVTVWDSNRNIIFPNQIESVNSNQIKIYFSSLVSGHVSVSRGGHILSGGAVEVSWDEVNNKPSGIVSGSSQIIYSGLTGVPSGIVSGSSQILNGSGIVSESSQISFNGITDKPALVSGSSQISYPSLSNIPSGLVSGSSQVLAGTTIHSGSFFNGITVVSGSSQISHDSTTGYVANQHIDHTTVSISPGSGLSGGGTIAATRTLTLDTGSVHFLDGVKKELNTDGVISGSLQVSFNGITDKPTTIDGYGITDINSYAPSLTGLGASGTWDINITGTAGGGGGGGVIENKSKSISLYSPTEFDNITMFYTEESISLNKVVTVLRGGVSASVRYNIRYDQNRSLSGTAITNDDIISDNTETGDILVAFDNSTIPANSFVWLEVLEVTNVVDEFGINLYWGADEDFKSVSLYTPSDSENLTLLYTTKETTITRLVSVIRGSIFPSVGFTVKYSNNRSNSGTEIITSGITVTNTTTGLNITTFDYSVIPANNFIWLETDNITGLVDELNVSLYLTF